MAPAREHGSARGSLRVSFGGLTTRGRSFLAAGIAAAVSAYILGQPELLRVGVLLGVLPLVCVAVLHRTRHRVTGARRLSPARVPVRSEARVQLRVENVSRVPTGMLMLQDQVPYVLGPRPRFVLDRIEGGGRREVSYRVRSDLRGRYPLGPLQLRVTDPFGMVELTRSFSTRDTLTVIPAVQALPPVRLLGEASGYGESRRRAIAVTGDDDVIPRAYRHGDDVRRVHWRSTARRGELMVRREEQPERARATVLLDTRRLAWAGSGPDSPFEWAVTGAASVAIHLLERDYQVRLLTDAGTLAPGPEGLLTGGDGPDTAGLLLDALAVVGHSHETGLQRAHDRLREGGCGLLVAFLGHLDPPQATLTARIRQRAGGAVALVPRGQQAPQTEEEQMRALREAGWTVVPFTPWDALPQVWQLADRTNAAGGGPMTTTGGVR
ncbi:MULTISPECIES: DUF58 domain-containing protein [unclassified Streptomyces]|uniref:DUF58 domain-containing protein n=1 Tax=unclassified Streptomyces TaxID=2593676 RepID=UPI0022B73B16|nr:MULTISPECIES: DUF58 domain-containing protein [unclassified Streptomyces]MCZ7413784.1 DUF58 domain-containing protein [Streptomyces sp. WMMC897]MCZ7430780.1 DUF58 domain-containing protein [Streptomyces sp. WMMC1477]